MMQFNQIHTPMMVWNRLSINCGYLLIVFSELENVLSTEQCRYNVPTKNKNLPANIQQAVAMSNNDDMEIDIDSDRGPRGTKEKSVQQKARGNKSNHRGLEEKEREQRQRE
jgi:hypothetical protein